MESATFENTEYQTILALKENITFDEKVDIEDLVLRSEQTGTPSMENIDIKEELMDPQFSSAQSFSSIDNNALKEKIDIKDLVLPSKPIGISNMEIVDIKEEPLDIDFIPVHERTKQIVHAFLHHEKQDFQSEIEREIEKLFGEFDMMSMREYDLTRVKKVKQLFEKYQTDNQKKQIINDIHTQEKCLEEKSYELTKIQQEFQKTKSVNFDLSQKIQELEIANNQISSENISLKAKVEEITKEHKTIMLLNAKNMSSIVKIHERQLEDKTSELNMIKQKLHSENVAKEEIARFTENRKNITENKLKEHDLLLNDETKPFNCSTISDDQFSLQKGLKAHVSKTHKTAKVSNTKKVDHICPICSKKYSTDKILKRHIKEHTASAQFSCPDENCDRKFSRSDKLKDHLVTHTGEKPYSCSMCPRKFSGPDARRRHMKNKSCGK